MIGVVRERNTNIGRVEYLRGIKKVRQEWDWKNWQLRGAVNSGKVS